MKKTKQVKKHKKIIDLYSLIKIKENNPPLNSVLKPDTNSDSPSTKSKGDRFLSAKQDNNHIIETPRKTNIVLNGFNKMKKLKDIK